MEKDIYLTTHFYRIRMVAKRILIGEKSTLGKSSPTCHSILATTLRAIFQLAAWYRKQMFGAHPIQGDIAELINNNQILADQVCRMLWVNHRLLLQVSWNGYSQKGIRIDRPITANQPWVSDHESLWALFGLSQIRVHHFHKYNHSTSYWTFQNPELKYSLSGLRVRFL